MHGLGRACYRSHAVETPIPADEMLRQMLQPQPPSTRPVKPTSVPSDASLEATPTVSAPTEAVTVLLREGSDVMERTGRLTTPVDGPLRQFVFTAVGGDAALPAMYVLPNLKLLEMETQLGATSRQLTFAVSGVITEYRDHNYILLDSGPEDALRNRSPDLSPAKPTTQPVAADQMLHQLIASDNSKPAASDSTAVPQPRMRHPAMTDDKSGPGASPPARCLR